MNWRSRSFKVIIYCCNWKPTCDFPLEINCHLSFISHRFRDIAGQTWSETTPPQFKPPIKGTPNFVIKLGRQRIRHPATFSQNLHDHSFSRFVTMHSRHGRQTTLFSVEGAVPHLLTSENYRIVQSQRSFVFCFVTNQTTDEQNYFNAFWLRSALEFCTGEGAGLSRRTPARFPAESGSKFRKISQYKRERDCELFVLGKKMQTWDRESGREQQPLL